ncbi:unnamed protein product [Aphis gossypii]|uniref:Uncharacterized protein n=1 Tax=Aphis gossypii TaxID=80765 RepID=A0A9P0ILS3_APHGO|nr:unnamed protein product [Aphis gossypii]
MYSRIYNLVGLFTYFQPYGAIKILNYPKEFVLQDFGILTCLYCEDAYTRQP